MSTIKIGHGPTTQGKPETPIVGGNIVVQPVVTVTGAPVTLTRRKTNISKTIYVTVPKDTQVQVDGVLLP